MRQLKGFRIKTLVIYCEVKYNESPPMADNKTNDDPLLFFQLLSLFTYFCYSIWKLVNNALNVRMKKIADKIMRYEP